MSWKAIAAALCVLAFAVPASAAEQSRALPCGLSPNDWCPAPPGDPCGKHPDKESCRADPACYGMPYHGESVVACSLDERGFGKNCPTVGCTAIAPGK